MLSFVRKTALKCEYCVYRELFNLGVGDLTLSGWAELPLSLLWQPDRSASPYSRDQSDSGRRKAEMSAVDLGYWIAGVCL